MEEYQVPIPEVPLALHEYILSSLGLGHPVVRAFTFFSVINGSIFIIKPYWAFDYKGTPKAWKLYSDDYKSTYVPWWLPGLVAGVYTGLFI